MSEALKGIFRIVVLGLYAGMVATGLMVAGLVYHTWIPIFVVVGSHAFAFLIIVGKRENDRLETMFRPLTVSPETQKQCLDDYVAMMKKKRD